MRRGKSCHNARHTHTLRHENISIAKLGNLPLTADVKIVAPGDSVFLRALSSQREDLFFVGLYLIQPGGADRDLACVAVVIPDRAVRQPFHFLQQRKARGEIAGVFKITQSSVRFKQRQ